MSATATQGGTETRAIGILTVDDHAPFRDAARALVSHMPGFDLVAECADGETALRLARSVDPDMVMIDVRMSGMDGIETARRLRSENPTSVIVLVTSAGVRELSSLAAGCGAAALVRKHWLTPRLVRGLWIAHRRR
jgi:DNA-binding NarL/FixJ family response regulator